MTDTSRTLRIQVLVALSCLALLLYLVLLSRSAILLIVSGRPATVGLGIALLLLPVIGLWGMIATLRTGFAHQRLARVIAGDGMELDVSALPLRRSGRIDRDAADELFDTVREELRRHPEDWRLWYRLARAYDYAGDRGRAHRTMQKAVALRDNW
jgi:cytochrome c-type biogenesis protein CcmH/NrfG